MRFEDFANFRVNFEKTVRTKFPGMELHACGPWSQGPVLPMALNILKKFIEAMATTRPTTSTSSPRRSSSRFPTATTISAIRSS